MNVAETRSTKYLLLLLLLLGPVTFAADTPVHAVMYEFTYNATTLTITHAQVIGGYPSVDECREAMPRVVALGGPNLDQGEKMQLQCSGIRVPAAEDSDSDVIVVPSKPI